MNNMNNIKASTNDMIWVSAVQRKNLHVAKAMWLKVPESQVSKELGRWRTEIGVARSLEPTCNTLACFGGWCTWVPEFREQGVRGSSFGSPYIDKQFISDFNDLLNFTTDPVIIAELVSLKLFGDRNMFNIRGEWNTAGSEDPFNGVSDWQIVMNRMNTVLANSVVL